jgi:starch phosphorylase
MFEQRIEGGQQQEVPDYWLQGHTNPWEVQRLDISYPVRFYGHVLAERQGRKTRFRWEGGELVRAQAYDSPIPG